MMGVKCFLRPIISNQSNHKNQRFRQWYWSEASCVTVTHAMKFVAFVSRRGSSRSIICGLCFTFFCLFTAPFGASVDAVHAQELINTAKPPTGRTGPSADKLFPPAHVEQHNIFSLDQARRVEFMDATPDGSHWYVIDAFANWQTITIDGHPFPQQFHEISASGTRLSPNGDFVLWTGLMRAYTREGFDSTMTYLYKDTSLIGNFLSDFPSIEFSRTGRRWAVMLPYAYETQKASRDFVVVDGKVVHKNEVLPHQFSFSDDEQHWAYRATDGLLEKLITDATDDTSIVLYKRSVPQSGSTWDPTIWRYTPDVTYYHRMLEGRDYDFEFDHVAKEYRTAYSSIAGDTARTYINYAAMGAGASHNQGLYRWIAQVLIDDSGHHITYVAADPSITRRTDSSDEHRAVIVYDGKVVAGPYLGVSNLFLSPSGRHYAYTLQQYCATCGQAGIAKFYLDQKLAYKTNQVVSCIWSPDESLVALVVVGEHEKLFVEAGGKRSPLFEQIGRVGWSPDGRHVEFMGISNGKLIAVKQSL